MNAERYRRLDFPSGSAARVPAAIIAGSETMAAYLIFTRDKTTDAAELATYSGLAGPSMAGHAVTPHVVYGKHEVLEGPEVEGVVVVSFPTVEEAKAWYDSPAYTAARAHRFKGADYRVVLVQGV
jgi:uncharacterized protein (DUF1330 family)